MPFAHLKIDLTPLDNGPMTVSGKFEFLVILGCFLLSPYSQTNAQNPTSNSNETDFFENEIRPILVTHCQTCHGPQKSKGGLKLTSRQEILAGGDNGPAIQAQKPEESLFLKAIQYKDDTIRMPPGGKLADRQIQALEKWVRQGAIWPGESGSTNAKNENKAPPFHQKAFWSFQPLKTLPAPIVQNKTWAKTPIDRWILAQLEKNNLTPAPQANRRTLLRRATFDLIGLPPTPAETDSFLGDQSPQAFEKVVNRLLASPLYGERWGRHWLDLVRFADARDLIQLPEDSDFRESWRYRDWVVDALNRDMSYADFVRYQIAGDLIPAKDGSGFNRDGLIATGMLAIADFVPGDTDKNQMIADYVNDQIDVTSRAFLGLSLACCRCHDHKFDPLTAEDYYALAGMFFSSRIIPSPVPGNTPLVKVPLLPPTEIERLETQARLDSKRRQELESTLPLARQRAYREFLTQMLKEQSASYLIAASKIRQNRKNGIKETPNSESPLNSGLLSDWVSILDQMESKSPPHVPKGLIDIAKRPLTDKELTQAAWQIQESLAQAVLKAQMEKGKSPQQQAIEESLVLSFGADDPGLQTDSQGKVLLWPNQTGFFGNATPWANQSAPVKTTAMVGNQSKAMIRFDGKSVLSAPGKVPPAGTMFLVYQLSPKSQSGERVVGWEDSDSGKHGLGLMTDPSGRLHAILRKEGQSGDLIDTTKGNGLEVICLTWGPNGTRMIRNGRTLPINKGITSLTSDPKIEALVLGGPGSGNSNRFQGDIAAIQVYNRPLEDKETQWVLGQWKRKWLDPGKTTVVPVDPTVLWIEELCSSRGPFWSSPEEQAARLPKEAQTRIAQWTEELNQLKKKKPIEIPKGVVIQDGGPKGTRHEGFKDAQIFVRGDPKRLGKTVPRGFPKVLSPAEKATISKGSGRLQLADWLTRPDNALTARVMVNRIWQHHFGEGLVRTPNDFGVKGELPTHPELLDYLAKRFVESGWSIKATHREIMLSAVYQSDTQTSSAQMAKDPDNRFFNRMNRQRLDAEAIRDSLLAVSGRLDLTRGGPPIRDVNLPRRTIYLISVRTGANNSDFGRLFDRADPGAIVARRDQSIVAPQALFFLNDPFIGEIAKSLAQRIAKEGGTDNESRIRFLYQLTLGRNPTPEEMDLARGLLNQGNDPEAWTRYCHLVISTNEFLYLN